MKRYRFVLRHAGAVHDRHEEPTLELLVEPAPPILDLAAAAPWATTSSWLTDIYAVELKGRNIFAL